MKAAGIFLLLLVATGPLAAGEPADAATTSSRLSAEIRAKLPAYVPPPDQPKNAPAAATTTDPDVLELPKMTVRENRFPTNDPDMWRSERDIQQRAMKAYKESMTPLEWAMNSWFIPFVSALPSVRARAAYRKNKLAAELDTMAHLAKVANLGDPKAGVADKKAVTDMERSDEWQSRPAGGPAYAK